MKVFINPLLIEPIGIEILQNFPKSLLGSLLLIEPIGIEIF